MSSENENPTDASFQVNKGQEDTNDVCDAKGNDSDQSVPHESVDNVEAINSSSASPSPSALKSGGSKDHEEGNDQPISKQMIDDPSHISWESGTIPTDSSPRVTVKLLVSNNMAGSIIGRSGQTVNELQSKSSAKIRLSQSGDYFPGTTDRICLMHGSLANVKKAVALVLGKLYELQLELLVETQLGHADQAQDDSSSGFVKTNSENPNPFKINFTTKVLVPSAACGMLIGKEGGTIQNLKEKAGCSAVRLSQKQLDHNAPRTSERVLTFSSFDLDACTRFTESILDGFVRHPEICRYMNGTTSYTKNSAIPSYMPRNNPVIAGYPNASNPGSNVVRQPYVRSGSIQELEGGVQGLSFDAQTNVPGGHVRQTSYVGSPPQGAINSPSTPFLSPNQSTKPPASSISFNSTINLAVPDSMIGALLGRRGQTLMELQSESGARIRVSQRDVFVPGTNNRIVSLSGNQESVNSARNMIRQLLNRSP